MFEMSVAQPAWLDVGRGFVPTAELFTNPGMLYIGIGKRYLAAGTSSLASAAQLTSPWQVQAYVLMGAYSSAA